MIIKKAETECYVEATTLDVKDNQIVLGLYDEVEERYFALIKVVEETKGKKKFFVSEEGLFLDSPSPALLKVFELEIIKFMKLNKIKSLTTTINGDVDIKKCGLKYSDVNTKEIVIYGSKLTRFL